MKAGRADGTLGLVADPEVLCARAALVDTVGDSVLTAANVRRDEIDLIFHPRSGFFPDGV